MAEISARLNLPYLMPSQAQKHVTHNEALQRLDALVQLSVLSRNVSIPPAAPAEGDSYIIPPAATDVWSGQDDQLAVWQAGSWQIIAPGAGWVAYVQDEGQLVRHLAGWQGLAQPQSTALLGINGTADTYNRFLVQSEGVLFNHNGAHQRTTINKAAVTDDASHNFQTGFASRALVGLLGSDDYEVKVSADGSSFTQALVVDHTSGMVGAPQGLRVGGTTAAFALRDVRSGVWTPTLGALATGDLAAATGLTATYASYVKAGDLVTLSLGFDLTGVGSAALSVKSAISVAGLPYAVRNTGGVIDQAGVQGMVHGASSPVAVTPICGGVEGPDIAHLVVCPTGDGEAQADDRFHVTLRYFTDD